MSVQYYDILFKNTTSSGISLGDLSGLHIPVSGTVNVSGLFPFQRLVSSEELDPYITNSGIVVNVEGNDLTSEEAVVFLSHHNATHIQGVPIGGGDTVGRTYMINNAPTFSGIGVLQYDASEEKVKLDEINFLNIADTPDSYAGYDNYIVHVNSTATGLDFSDFGEYNRQFGNNFIYELDPTESSTSSTTFIEKLTLSRAVPTGTYRVGWYFEWDVSSESAIFYARVQINDVADIGTLASTAAAAQTSWSMTSGFHYLTMVSGTLQIDLDYRCAVSNKTAYIRNARLEFWRTE